MLNLVWVTSSEHKMMSAALSPGLLGRPRGVSWSWWGKMNCVGDTNAKFRMKYRKEQWKLGVVPQKTPLERAVQYTAQVNNVGCEIWSPRFKIASSSLWLWGNFITSPSLDFYGTWVGTSGAVIYDVHGWMYTGTMLCLVDKMNKWD